MRALHHPASGSEAGVAFNCPGFFPTRPDVGRKAKFPQGVLHFLIVVAFVQTHPLRVVLGRTWPLHYQALYGLLNQSHVMPIGPCHGQADRYAVSFGQQAAFDTALGAVGGIGPRFFPLQEELLSSPHPCSASSSLALSGHQTVPPRLSITSGRLRPPPILETDHGPWNEDTNRRHLTLPTDSPYARRRKWRRRTADRGLGGVPRQSDACSYAWAARAPTPPTVHRQLETLLSLCSPALDCAPFLSVPSQG